HLSALTASLVEADLLVILSDVEGLHTRDPRLDPEAGIVRLTRADDAVIREVAGPSRSEIGTGGMVSKGAAAPEAAAGGLPPVSRGGTGGGGAGGGVGAGKGDGPAPPPRGCPPRPPQALDRLRAEAVGSAPPRRGRRASGGQVGAESPALRRAGH